MVRPDSASGFPQQISSVPLLHEHDLSSFEGRKQLPGLPELMVDSFIVGFGLVQPGSLLSS